MQCDRCGEFRDEAGVSVFTECTESGPVPLCVECTKLHRAEISENLPVYEMPRVDDSDLLASTMRHVAELAAEHSDTSLSAVHMWLGESLGNGYSLRDAS